MTEPTNADLFVLIENNNDSFLKHAVQDEEVAKAQAIVNKAQGEVNEEVKGSLASLHEWKQTVATKEDIKELKEFMKQVNFGIGIFRFSWNNAAKIGSFIVLIAAIYFFFKAGFIAALAWFATNNPIK